MMTTFCDGKIDESKDEAYMMAVVVVVVLLTSLPPSCCLSWRWLGGEGLVAEWFRRAWHAKPWCAASDSCCVQHTHTTIYR